MYLSLSVYIYIYISIHIFAYLSMVTDNNITLYQLIYFNLRSSAASKVIGNLGRPGHLYRNLKIHPHPRLQDFPRWKKTQKNT